MRGKSITFDLAVEVRRVGATDPFFVWILECKNYVTRVPVDDVEEFHAKLEQVGADRTKGTVITPVGFDPGAVEFAKAQGIGLCRYIPDGSLVYLMEDDRQATDRDILEALTTPSTDGFRFFGTFYGMTTHGRLVADRDLILQAELADVSGSP